MRRRGRVGGAAFARDQGRKKSVHSEPLPGGHGGNRQKGDHLDQVFIDDETVFGPGRFEQFGNTRPGRNGQIKRQQQHGGRNGRDAGSQPDQQQTADGDQGPNGGAVDPLLFGQRFGDRSASELFGRQQLAGFRLEIGFERPNRI